MKKRSIIFQDIDQPVFRTIDRTPRRIKWLILVAIALIVIGIARSVLLIRNTSVRKGQELEKPAFSELELSPTPTVIASPAGTLRMRWQEVKRQLDALDPQQSALQPPELDFNISL